jgi:hypothetical protein
MAALTASIAARQSVTRRSRGIPNIFDLGLPTKRQRSVNEDAGTVDC